MAEEIESICSDPASTGFKNNSTLRFVILTPCGVVGKYHRFRERKKNTLHLKLKMKTACSSETLVVTYESAQCHSPEQ